MKKSFVHRSIVILFCVSLVVLFCLLVISIILIINKVNSSVSYDSKKQIHSYQQYVLDGSRNESYFGIITSFDQISTEGIFYQDDEEKYTLISNFGTDEYECFGSCYCEKIDNHNNNNRRVGSSTTGQTLTKGILYLVGAVSTYSAIDFAKSYFDEQCASEYKDSCDGPDSIIRSEVDTCEMAFWNRKTKEEKEEEEKEAIETKEEEEEEEEVKNKKKKKKNKKKYLCKGNCVRRFFPSQLDCRELSLFRNRFRGKISVPQSWKFWITLLRYKECPNLKLEKQVNAATLEDAKSIFLEKELHSFCWMNLKHELTRDDGSIYVTSYCAGYDFDHENLEPTNPSAVCRKIKI